MNDVLEEGLCRELMRAAEAAYPLECCGVLFGGADGRADGFCEAENRAPAGSAGRHFTIDPLWLYRQEQSAGKAGRQIVGFYHSHPDCAAYPSDEDAEGMIPEQLYLILSVREGRCVECRVYRKMSLEPGQVPERFL